jgi:hypothetical protein
VIVKQHETARILLLLSLVLILNGCAYQHSTIPPAPTEISAVSVEIKPEMPVSTPYGTDLEMPDSTGSEPRFYPHKVRWPEETLSHIAKWYTGAIKNWKVIAKANFELDPKKIGIGDTISIPEDLLITRKPIPHSFVRKVHRKIAASISSSNKTSKPAELPKLFGPIETQSSPIESNAAKLFGPIE